VASDLVATFGSSGHFAENRGLPSDQNGGFTGMPFVAEAAGHSRDGVKLVRQFGIGECVHWLHASPLADFVVERF